MTGILLTQSTTPIIGQISWLLGKVMNGIYELLNVIGIQNIGLCIILYTIVVYTFMLPLTLKQQRFSKMSAVMNPELQKIQKKYKNKRDQASMQKQQEETQLVYEKYGMSPMGGCSQLLIQMPLFFGLYAVIRNIPAYVDKIQLAYMKLVDPIMQTPGFQKIMETIGKDAPVLMKADKFDYSKADTLVDVLYKFNDSAWAELSKAMPNSLDSVIEQTKRSVEHLNSFMGLNIAETPLGIIKSSWASGQYIIIVLALLIPIFAGLTQYLNIKLMPQAGQSSDKDGDNAMMNSMNTVNKTMPLLSVFMCFTFPAGLGIYWVASAVVRSVQQVIINRYLSRQSLDDMIKKNQEKAAKKREKKGTSASKLNEMAQRNVKNIQEPKKFNSGSTKENEEKLAEASQKNQNAKPGSLASKANLVKQYNENNKK